MSQEEKGHSEMQVRRIFRSGGSLCIAMPREYLRAIGASLGDYVAITMADDDRLQLVRVRVDEDGRVWHVKR